MMLFCLLLWGATYLVTASAIMRVPRVLLVRFGPSFFETLFYCAACTGTWIGICLALLGAWPYEHQAVTWYWLDAGIASAGLMAAIGFYVPSNAWNNERHLFDGSTE